MFQVALAKDAAEAMSSFRGEFRFSRKLRDAGAV